MTNANIPTGSIPATSTNTTTTTTNTTITSAIAATSVPTDIDDSNPIPPSTDIIINGYKVHPSALASMSSTPKGMSAVSAAEHVAAIAAMDSLHSSGTQRDNRGPSGSRGPPESPGFFEDLAQRLMPLGLALVMGYMFYIYIFHVCINYILQLQHRSVQAAIYAGTASTITFLFFISYIRCMWSGPGSPLKKKIIQPIPATTTLYDPQKPSVNNNPQPQQHASIENNLTPVTDTTPLLQSTRVAPGASQQQYQSTQTKQHNGINNDAIKINMGMDTPTATLSVAKRDGRRRWCDICKIYKPDRCHHCSACDECVLRMDHHCPWVRCCIGYGNHKFFYLFIFYTSFMTLWVVATMIPLIVTSLMNCQPNNSLFEVLLRGSTENDQCIPDNHWIIITALAFLLSLFILPFTIVHTINLVHNRTTIEGLQDTTPIYVRIQYTDTNLPPHWSNPRFQVVKLEGGENMWNLGSRMANWRSIMGYSWWLWFIPYNNTQGDGIHDAYSSRTYERLLHQAMRQGSTQIIRYESNAGKGVSNSSALLSTNNRNVNGEGSSQIASTPKSNGTEGLNYKVGSSSVNFDRDLAESEGQRASPVPVRILSGANNQDWSQSKSSVDSESSIGSLGRSLPTPRTSPRLDPIE